MTNEFLDLLDGYEYHPEYKDGSYDYTKPQNYVTKDRRPGTTGLYRRADNWYNWGPPKASGSKRFSRSQLRSATCPKSSKRRRGSGR